MVKAIAYAKIKTDKVDAHMLADLDQTGMIPKAYIPNEKMHDMRDLVCHRQSFVRERTMHKNKIKVELAKRWLDTKASPSTQPRQKRLRDLKIEAVNDSLDAVLFLDEKILQMDMRIRGGKHHQTNMQNC